MQHGRWRAGRAGTTLALAVFVLQGAACAAATQSWRAGPAGIPAERSLRDQLAAGRFESAWEAVNDKHLAPADALLRHMYKGVVGLHAGEWETGARAMDRAWEIAYQRWTKRLGNAALSMVTSDAVLPYDPGPAELMFIPYYGGLTWLARDERQSAAVEARRLSTLLASDVGPQPADDFRGVMRYVAGVMYEMAGERNDADVSFRNAALLLGGAIPGDTLPADSLHGDVVVVIEDGFVGHPQPAAMTFWFTDTELSHLSGDDEHARVSTVGTLRHRRHESRQWGVGYRAVTFSWPEFGEPRRVSGPLGVRAAGTDSAAVGVAALISADVTGAVRADFDREQPGRLARAIARAAVREAALRAAGRSFEAAVDGDKKRGDKKDDDGKNDGQGKAIGKVLLGIGLLATGATSAVLDQPDLRAWQLLPDRVSVARLRLPLGDHAIEVTRDGEAVTLGTVSVRPGSVTLLTHRWWPAPRDTRTLVENGRELPDYLSRGAHVVDPGDGLSRLPVLAPGVVLHQ